MVESSHARKSPLALRRFPRAMIMAVLALIAWLALAAWTLPAAAFGPGDPDDPSTPDASPTSSNPGFIPERLQQPPMPANPTLADKGAQTWWNVCMACHGDAGQGLTDEWRETAFGEDMNCWEAKCHGPRHPEYGFTFPRIVPPAWGGGTLKRFVTASELQGYLKETMPWWNPGSLTDEQAWELTALVLRRNGALPKDLELNISEAALLPVHQPIRAAGGERDWSLAFTGILTLTALAIAAARILPARPAPVVTAVHTSTAPDIRTSQPQRAGRPSFFHHLHPPTIPLPQARWRYTLGAGGLAVFLGLALVLTGILEMFVYIPTPDQAAQSIQTITFQAPFGWFIRGVHFWAAQALVVVAIIHMARVILTGAFSIRRFNYLLGLALLIIVLLLDFTGYVLRWDEGIRWALMVGTNLLKTIPVVGDGLYTFVIGGSTPELPTLTRFYAWHIYGLTTILVALVAWHIFRVRRDGGIAAPPHAASGRLPRNELVKREVLAMLVSGGLLALVAVLLPTPLAPALQDSPTALLADGRAPWFFLWIQQLLRQGDAFWMGVAAPLGVLLVLAALPYLTPRLPLEASGRWFPRAGRVAQIAIIVIILALLALTVLELMA